ncbi:MAG: tRNA (adenosine(37)-N6)-dimethylallyltransferase MiaA [Bdellovibrionota bacterium]
MKKKCIFVLGPTASGKSAWALLQAEKYKGSIINIDSVQLYKGLIIGSAAPTEEEKRKIPHYLYSYVEAPKEMTAGDYLKDFYQLLESNIRFPLFIVGGTGFYIQALEKGMFNIEPVPIEFRKSIEEELAARGAEGLYAELKEKDPDTKIHINDHYRLVRAIEIIRYTGTTPTELNKKSSENKNEFPFEYIKVGFDFDKSDFEERVKRRTKKIIEAGIIEETTKFYNLNLADWAPLQSVGYKETVEFLRSSKSKEWLFEAINQSTMQLIKKQKTWFKRDKSVLWSNQEQSLAQFLA